MAPTQNNQDDNTQPNMDVYSMMMALSQQQAELKQEEQEQLYRAQNPGGYPVYGDQQAAMTGMRASYGDIPAMMMSGVNYAGAAIAGAGQGLGNMLSAIGSRIMPVTYTPPARMQTGHYGQYSQETSFLGGLRSFMNLVDTPSGVSPFRLGYHNVSDFGERIGGGIAAAGTATAGLAVGAPVGAKLGGILGGVVGAAFGPLGVGIGSALGSLAGGMVGYTGVDAIGEVFAQRRQMNAYLESSSFRYIGAGSSLADPRLGSGMNMSARRQSTDFMRQMDITDPTMNLDDMFNILRGASELGMMSGISDLDDFKKKFKNIVSGVKQVASTLNTTLEEGLRFMKEFKSIGIDASQMSEVTFQAAAMGKVAGRTAQEMVGIGMQGAELFRGTGIQMGIGYQQNVMNMSSIRAARDAGLISQELISQAGGEEALAQRMTASSMQFMQSAMGRGFGAAFFNPAAGPAGFDLRAFTAGAMQGGMSIQDLAMRGAENLGTPGKIIAYQANQDKFLSEMGKAFGGKGLDIARMNAAMASAQYLVQTGATENVDEALRYTLLTEQGMSPPEADALIAMTKNAGKAFRAQQAATENTMMQRQIDEAMRSRSVGFMVDTTLDYGKRLIEPVVQGAESRWDNIKEGLLTRWEKNILGIERADVRGISYSRISDLTDMKGQGGAPGQLMEGVDLDENMNGIIGAGLATSAALAAFPTGVTQVLGGLVAGSTLAYVGFQELITDDAGEQLKQAVTALEGFGLGAGAITKGDTLERGEVSLITDKNDLTQSATYQKVKQSDLVKALHESKSLGMTYEEAEKVADKDSVRTIETALARGQVTNDMNLAEISKKIFGKEPKDLRRSELAALFSVANQRGEGALADAVKVAKEGRYLLEKQTDASLSKLLVRAEDSLGDSANLISEVVGLDEGLTKEELSELTDIRYVEGTSIADKEKQLNAVLNQYVKVHDITQSGEEYRQLRSTFAGIAGLIVDPKTQAVVGRSDKALTYRGTTGETVDLMQQARRSLETISGVQTARGELTLQRAFTQQLEQANIDEQMRDKVEKAMFDIQKQGVSAISALDPEVAKVFESFSSGAYLLKAPKIQEALEKMEISLEKEFPDPSEREKQVKERATDAVKNIVGDPQSTDRIVDMYLRKGDAKDMTGNLIQLLNQNLASGQAVYTGRDTGALGGAEAKGIEQGSAQEIATVQMNVNLQVLQALQALNSRMR